MSFESLQLSPLILKAIAACGYTTPTPIQAQAIPLALEGKDLIASAQTGTGKTAAFTLPSLQRLTVRSPLPGRGPRILVLTPTRELANQVTDAVRSYGKFMRVTSGAILGGMPYREQLMLLSRPVDLIVATPGRLIDHLDRGKINLSRLELLILDEADRMLDMGFSEDVDRIAAAAPANRQTLLFTATMDDVMAKLAQRLLKDPVRIEIAGKKTTHEQIEQRLHVADNLQHKTRMLQHLIADESVTKAIIFSATKRDADLLARDLHAQGHAAAALHGDMSQNARNKTIHNMRRGKIRLLVATDVAARGLDVSGISHVINFDLPKFAEDYVHRIGRTGRAGATGVAISFASLNDLNYLDRIERYTGQTLPMHVIPGLEPTRPLRRLNNQGKRSQTANGRGKTPYAGNGRRPGKDDRKSGGFAQARKSAAPRSRTSEPVVEYRSLKPGRGTRQS
ncbi:DEAD/DEAH box helicase [Geotalea sp. SG265]|uniref:DEAD/DEAH box helicase n=1 Tax=Geotalea sp. SG265 TaxID=2922867 RepID=UPI001FAE8260|nr:DEAD/DEAH box helicase [Geotalea sp. SG265]